MRRPWSTGRLPAGFLLLMAASSLVGAVAVAQEGGAGFAPAERERLLAGQLVRRPTTSREGSHRYIGGTSFQRVPAPQEQVWQMVLDEQVYPHLIPGLQEVRVIEREGNRSIMRLRHQYSFVNASYHAVVTVEARHHTVHFELDHSRPADIRDGRGFITVDSYRGGSIVTWGVRADVGQGLLTGVFAPVIHDWILRPPHCIRGYARGRIVC
ncbi:MAG: SRPBCC family protein [Sandaracinaceae bacterium]